MTVYDLFILQITDPFRLGLLAILLITTRNTLAQTGFFLPLLAGVVFVAILIPLTFTPQAADWWLQVGVGLLSNVIILAVILALYFAAIRFFPNGESKP